MLVQSIGCLLVAITGLPETYLRVLARASRALKFIDVEVPAIQRSVTFQADAEPLIYLVASLSRCGIACLSL